ncbi:MAG TPA: CHAT domain-containing protein, partial [Candidatus Dormibacteraeota bacterium]|nr:CHAT domain-containing protein [Candidatus Dormibacteraeota bacterium]
TINPMLRSGLALAGAQRTLQLWRYGETVAAHEDGILTAAEIGDLDLQGTWLVVLSACDTGAGEARAGEGVLGLRRGFVQAGAQNLLMTLWPIDDQQTTSFIPEFYARAHRTGSPSRALAEVQRAWLQRLRREKGVAEACRVAGPFILSFQGRPPTPHS